MLKTTPVVANSFFKEFGAPVAQKVKHWPAALAVLGLRPAGGENLFNQELGFIAHSLSFSSSHQPDMTEVLLKRTKNHKLSIFKQLTPAVSVLAVRPFPYCYINPLSPENL